MAPRKKKPADDDDDSEVGSDAAPPPNPIPPDLPDMITEAEYKRRGAIDSESMARNQQNQEIIASRRSGKSVPFNGPPEDRYYQVMQSYPGQCQVSIDRVQPGTAKMGTIQGITVPTFEDLQQFVADHFWNGTQETYRFMLRYGGVYQTVGTWSYPENPEAQFKWSQRMQQTVRQASDAAFRTATGIDPVHGEVSPRVFSGNRRGEPQPELAVELEPTELPFDSEEDDMAKGYWVTNGQPGAQPLFVPPGAPPPPGFYPLQPVAPPAPTNPYAPPAAAPPPVGSTWNGQAWVAPPAPAPAAPPPTHDDAVLRELRELRESHAQAQDVERLKREQEQRQVLEDMRGAIGQLAKAVANVQQGQQTPAAPAAAPAFMQNVPPGAIWNGSQFVMPAIGTAASKPQADTGLAPSDALDTALSMTKKLAGWAGGSGGIFPKAEAGLGPAIDAGEDAVVAPPRKLTFEHVGGDIMLGFKQDGDIALGPSLIPFIPKVIHAIEKGMERWESVQHVQANAAAEESRKHRAALERAMQIVRERDYENTQLRSQLGTHSHQPAAPMQQPAAPATPQQHDAVFQPETSTSTLGAEEHSSVTSQGATDDGDSMSGALYAASRRLRPTPPTPQG